MEDLQILYGHFISGLKGKCQRSFLQVAKANIDLNSFLPSIARHEQVLNSGSSHISMILFIVHGTIQ